jgi:hypothetical protein
MTICVTAALGKIKRHTRRGSTDRAASESAHWSRSRAVTSSGFGMALHCARTGVSGLRIPGVSGLDWLPHGVLPAEGEAAPSHFTKHRRLVSVKEAAEWVHGGSDRVVKLFTQLLCR